MIIKYLFKVFPVLIAFLALSCAATFSPQSWRREIERQTGEKPKDSFEFCLDGTTMQLAKSVVSRVAGEQVSFGGLARIDLAVFDLPAGKQLEFSRINTRGWDKLISTRENRTSLMVLVRSDGERLGDMVLVAQGENQVLYGRLKGDLDPDMPSTLQRVLEATGIQGLKDHILSGSGEKSSVPPPSVKK